MRLAIAIPSNRDHNPFFTESLVKLTAHIVGQTWLEGVVFDIKTGCSNLSAARQQALDNAIKHGLTHILFIDDDMAFPANILDVLFSRHVSVVGVNACRKTPDRLLYTATCLDGSVMESKDKKGIEVAEKIGFGCVLIDLEAIKNIPAPHFEVPWTGKSYQPEDYSFCKKMRENGVMVHVDHDVSNHIGHVGDCIYNFNFYKENNNEC